MASAMAEGSSGQGGERKGPVVVLLVGMAGSGKTTLVQRLAAELHSQRKAPYVVNLDPAVHSLPYEANVDARDTVDYAQVMSEYGLGPNGGILTACNLFATRFDQVMDILAKRERELDYVLVDTPGQIETFTWSASGEIVLQALAARYTTTVSFVLDSGRCSNPQRFMSNMLQAVSVAYRSKLPVMLSFNKVDSTRHEFALEWMRDLDAYQEALHEVNTYATDLSFSLALVLDQFYRELRTVGTSAFTGEGVNDFFASVNDAAREFEHDIRPEIEKAQREEAHRQSLRNQAAAAEQNGQNCNTEAEGKTEHQQQHETQRSKQKAEHDR